MSGSSLPLSRLPRVGIVVPRHQHSAVDRNRLKRRLRELVRLELLPALRDAAARSTSRFARGAKRTRADVRRAA